MKSMQESEVVESTIAAGQQPGISVREFAALKGWGLMYCYQLIWAKKLAARKVGRNWVIDISELRRPGRRG